MRHEEFPFLGPALADREKHMAIKKSELYSSLWQSCDGKHRAILKPTADAA